MRIASRAGDPARRGLGRPHPSRPSRVLPGPPRRRAPLLAAAAARGLGGPTAGGPGLGADSGQAGGRCERDGPGPALSEGGGRVLDGVKDVRGGGCTGWRRAEGRGGGPGRRGGGPSSTAREVRLARRGGDPAFRSSGGRAAGPGGGPALRPVRRAPAPSGGIPLPGEGGARPPQALPSGAQGHAQRLAGRPRPVPLPQAGLPELQGATRPSSPAWPLGPRGPGRVLAGGRPGPRASRSSLDTRRDTESQRGGRPGPGGPRRPHPRPRRPENFLRRAAAAGEGGRPAREGGVARPSAVSVPSTPRLMSHGCDHGESVSRTNRPTAGLRSVARNNKATRLLTRPGRTS